MNACKNEIIKVVESVRFRLGCSKDYIAVPYISSVCLQGMSFDTDSFSLILDNKLKDKFLTVFGKDILLVHLDSDDVEKSSRSAFMDCYNKGPKYVEFDKLTITLIIEEHTVVVNFCNINKLKTCGNKINEDIKNFIVNKESGYIVENMFSVFVKAAKERTKKDAVLRGVLVEHYLNKLLDGSLELDAFSVVLIDSFLIAKEQSEQHFKDYCDKIVLFEKTEE